MAERHGSGLGRPRSCAGTGESDRTPGFGGGILVAQGGSLRLDNVSVRGNSAEQGGGIGALGSVLMFNLTVSGNPPPSCGKTSGGGIAVGSAGLLGMLKLDRERATRRPTTGGGTSSRRRRRVLGGRLRDQLLDHRQQHGRGWQLQRHPKPPRRPDVRSSTGTRPRPPATPAPGPGIGAMTATNDVAERRLLPAQGPEQPEQRQPRGSARSPTTAARPTRWRWAPPARRSTPPGRAPRRTNAASRGRRREARATPAPSSTARRR